MSTIEPLNEIFRLTNRYRKYTLIEATDYMKEMDRQPTQLHIQWSWVNSITKKPVTIGYT